MSAQNIDFLPPSYRENRLRRQKKVWHRGVAGLFVVCAIAGTIQQYRTQRELEATRERIRHEAQWMADQLGSPQALQQGIHRLDAQANLFTFLRLRVPPTRILAALTNSLPRYVSLTDLALKAETIAPALGAAERQAASSLPGVETAPFPEETDLARLQTQAEETAWVVSVNGIAPDDVAISRYFAALQAEGVFAEVKLLFTDEHISQEQRLRRFGLRLTLQRPGRERNRT